MGEEDFSPEWELQIVVQPIQGVPESQQSPYQDEILQQSDQEYCQSRNQSQVESEPGGKEPAAISCVERDTNSAGEAIASESIRKIQEILSRT